MDNQKENINQKVGVFLFVMRNEFVLPRPSGRREWGDEPKRTQWVIKRGEEVAVVEIL
jgi:hypothetical protein